MIAAKDMTFFDCQCHEIGATEELLADISKISKIEAEYLRGNQHKTACIAVKMSWLSRRKTKFDEDMVYCLPGLFGVQMYIRYGEDGENAFRRPQHTLINKYPHDELIFTWLDAPAGLKACGLLARWPSHFEKCMKLISLPRDGHGDQIDPSIARDENGIEVRIPAKKYHINNGADWNNYDMAKLTKHKLVLHCQVEGNASKHVCVQMMRDRDSVWRRVPTDTLILERPPKASKGSLTVTVPHSAALDTSEEPIPVQRSGFGKIRLRWNAAIAARKGL